MLGRTMTIKEDELIAMGEQRTAKILRSRGMSTRAIDEWFGAYNGYSRQLLRENKEKEDKR